MYIQSLDRIEDLIHVFDSQNYICDKDIAVPVFISLKLGKPLLVEGEPGCGKTELAKVLAEAMGTELIRLQCYEGLDVNTAVYEWDYLRQLVKIRLEENKKDRQELESEIFSERFLLKRPLLKAATYKGKVPPVLLIDEVDRADEEFEGFLLEFLGEFQVSIPEIGTLKSEVHPVVILTSNRTREIGEGLRRRCIYLYVGYPSREKEFAIIKRKVPQAEAELVNRVVDIMAAIRNIGNISKKPGVSESLDWTKALSALGKITVTEADIEDTIGCIAKSPDDLAKIKSSLSNILS